MKITVLNDRGIISDNIPIILDIRETAKIRVITPDDKTYVFGFIGKTETKSLVQNGLVELPKNFLFEQTLRVVIYRKDDDGIVTLPCEPIKLYKLANKDLFGVYVESAIGQTDVRDVSAEAILRTEQLTAKNEELKMLIEELSKKNEALKTALSATKEDLASFKAMYNKSVEAINDLLGRVENIEADYDILVK